MVFMVKSKYSQPSQIIELAIPSTFTAESKNIFVRTFRIGQLVRWALIHKVHRVYVYHDKDPLFDSRGLGRYIVKVMRYALVPPALKKRAFALKQTNRAFGVIPAKNIAQPHWVVALRTNKDQALVTDGAKKWWVRMKESHGTAFMANSTEQLLPEESPQYEGFYVHFHSDLGTLAQTKRGRGYRIIGASARGRALRSAPKFDRALIVFGSAFRDIFEIEKDIYDDVWAIPEDYPTRTLRTDEAVVKLLTGLRWLNRWSV